MSNENMFGLHRPVTRPAVERVRFTPSQSNADFLAECKEMGYDISTIINLALNSFKPKTMPNGFTWGGIKDAVDAGFGR